MTLIHTPTLFLVLAAIALLAAGAVWHEHQRSGGRALRLWIGAYLAAAGLAISSLVLFPFDPGLAVVLPTGFGALALALMSGGLALHLGHPLRLRYWVLLPVALWLTLGLFRWHGEPLSETYVERRIAICLVYSGYAASACALLLTADRVTWAKRALATVFGLYAFFYVLRLAMLSSGFVPNETALADLWVTFSIYKAILFVAASAYLFLAVWRERSELDLRVAADADPLTGLPNRRTFRRRAERKLAGERPFVLCIIDLDNFKSVNDTCGHGVGDAVLCEFAAVLRASLRPTDLCSRIGGEEFAWLLDGETPHGAVQRLAATAASFRQTTANIADLPFASTFSAGIVASTEGGDLDSMMARADAALYRAKRAGRDRVEVAGERPMPAVSLRLGGMVRS